VPPQQCPECGRFLKKAFVESLSATPTPCPRCEAGLTAAMLGVVTADPVTADPAVSVPAGGAQSSVRPPDLQPGTVRDGAGDVLAGWDRDGAPGVVDRAPFPTDLVVMLSSGAVGALLGGLFGERGCRGAILGGASGILGAAVARQVWRLPGA
jgi:hypothetical protein